MIFTKIALTNFRKKITKIVIHGLQQNSKFRIPTAKGLTRNIFAGITELTASFKVSGTVTNKFELSS